MLYNYEVHTRLEGDAQADGDASDELIKALNADSILAIPGYLEVVGTIDADTIHEAGETLRGVLNRIVLTLSRRGYKITAEGWNLTTEEDET